MKKAIADAFSGRYDKPNKTSSKNKPSKQRGREIRPIPPGAPTGPFVVPPRDIYVIDGDTISVRIKYRDSVEPMKLRIRLRSVAAPEMPHDGLGDDILRDVGIDTRAGHPGMVSRDALRELLAERAIFVEPRGGDRYGRLIADVSASGDYSGEFEPRDSFSVERELLRLRMVGVFPGEELPDALTIGVRCRASEVDVRDMDPASRPEPTDEEDHPCLDWF